MLTVHAAVCCQKMVTEYKRVYAIVSVLFLWHQESCLHFLILLQSFLWGYPVQPRWYHLKEFD